jgi:hypothetical protein
MINRWLLNVVTDSLSRPLAFALPGRGGAIFAPDDVQVFEMQGAFSLPCSLGPGLGGLAVHGKTFLPPTVSGWGRLCSGLNLDSPRGHCLDSRKPDPGGRRNFVQGHPEFCGTAIDLRE